MSVRNNQDHFGPFGGSYGELRGFIMMLVLTGVVGFVGLAMAMLDSGRDLNFNNRQVASAYRRRWA